MAGPARDRLLDTTERLFYNEGIRAVGIDRILAESGVAKSSMYAHFRTKEDLVVAYLRRHSEGFRAYFDDRLEGTAPGAAAVLVAFDALDEGMRQPGFRGCAFVNASVEYPSNVDIRAAVDEHRRWLEHRFTALLDVAPERRAPLAALLLQLSTGASMTAYVDNDPRAGRRARDAAAALLRPPER